MIRVAAADEPESFDAKVRQKGLRAIAELVGESTKRRGPRRKEKGTYATRDAIPPRSFPDYWTEAIPDLRQQYGNVCAYLALFLHKPGKASVDHFVPKSKDWTLVYEWDNYRLCDPIVNGSKGERQLLDPFTVEPGFFQLELVEYQVILASGGSTPPPGTIKTTLEILNMRDCCEPRREYAEAYFAGGIALRQLERWAPFVAQELRRQGRLNPGDV